MKTEIHRDAALLARGAARPRPDVICLSHLRWDAALGGPRHLLSRCARQRRVFFVEEPGGGADFPLLDVREAPPGVRVAVPRLPAGLDQEQTMSLRRRLLGEMVRRHGIKEYILWYTSPSALPFTRDLTPRAVIYDCAEEPGARGADGSPPPDHEAELLRRSHLVLVEGYSLYEARRALHPNIHPVPGAGDAPRSHASWDRAWAEVDALLARALRERRPAPGGC